MKQLFFWNRWHGEHKNLYVLFLGIFFLSLVFYGACYIIGIDAVIRWDVTTVMEPFSVTIDRFTHNLFDYSVDAESYLLRESFHASDVKINLLPAYIFFFFLLIAVLTLITVSTFLESFSYFIGTGILMLFIVTLNLELLSLFGFSNKIPAGALILLFGGISYFFHAFKKEINFTKRLLVFAATALLCGVVISFGTKAGSPLLYLSNFGIALPIVLTLFFIAINGFDVIALFVYLTAGNRNTPDNKGRIRNFIVISILYLLNILLVLLRKMLIIDWDIVYVNVFFLYAVTSVISIWGYKKRSVIFKDFIPFNPLGGLFYLSLGIIANATLAYSFITGNDPLSECFEYGILYSQLFFGIVFLMYVLINFGALFHKNISVYDIIYKPLNVPFFMVRGIAGVGILSIFFYSNRFALYLGLAGYFNLGGDVYKHENNLLLAKQYYRSGMQSEFQNQRSNYSLACIAAAENNKEVQLECYSRSLVKRPLEFSYINLSNLYLKENAYFQAMFILKDGLQKFPQSGHLANNLAILYNRTRLLDSTLYYLHLSLDNLSDPAVPAANILYVAIKNNLIGEADSLGKQKTAPDDFVYQSNKILLQNLLNRDYRGPAAEVSRKDSLLPVTFSLLYNHAINKLKQQKGAIALQDLDSLIGNPANAGFSESLQFLKILKLYYSGNKKEAFILLENLKNTSSNSYFNKVAGIWAFEQQAYIPAADNFLKTINTGGPAATLNYCMAMAESGNFKIAATDLAALTNIKDGTANALAEGLKDIISENNPDTILSWSENKKLQFIHLRRNTTEEALTMKLYGSLKNEYYRQLAAAEIVDLLLNRNKIEEAGQVYKNITERSQAKTPEEGALNLVYLQLLDATKEWTILQSSAAGLYLTRDRENLRSYFLARAAEETGNKKSAGKFYDQTLLQAPYFEKGIVHAMYFYNAINNTSHAYDIIADAVQFYPSSVLLLKAFALQALRNGLESYGEEALVQLSQLLPAREYEIFEKEYEQQKQETEAKNETM